MTKHSTYPTPTPTYYGELPKEPVSQTCPKWAIALSIVAASALVGAVIATAVVFSRNNGDCDGFRCTSGALADDGSNCILSSNVCNSVKDCKNGEDENDCPAISPCTSSQFWCMQGGLHGNCIPKDWVCDGSDDCVGGTDEQNCTGAPACRRTENLQVIAPNCERDVGNCSVSFCSNDVNPKCCGPVYERKISSCPGGNIEYSKVLRCECQICESPRAFVAGSFEGCDSKLHNCSFGIEINETEVGRANKDGHFSFSVEYPSNYRITFSVIDDVDELFFTQVKIINLISNQYAYSVTVKMVLKPTAISFSSNTNTTVELGTTQDVAIEFGAHSMFLPDGTEYDGEVKAAINFIDPSNRENSQNIPAQLLTENDDEEGVPGFLSSTGMLQTDIKTADGRQLNARGVQIELITDGLSQEEIDEVKLFKLIETDGVWQEVSQMNASSGTSLRRRRRSNHASVMTRVDISSVRQIYNLDALLRPYCYMKVRVFSDAQYLESTQTYGIAVISLYARSSNGAWANYLRGYTYYNGICVSVPCNGKWFDIVQVYAEDKDYIVVEPIVPDDVKTELNFQNKLNYFTVQIPRGGAVQGSKGPIYQDGYDCYRAPFEDYHFRLSRFLPEDIEVNTIPIDENNIFSPWINDVFSWWPNRNLFKACYVKLNVLPIDVIEDDLKEWTVEAISRGGTHTVTKGKEYGRRISQGNGLTACVEYKCPDILSDNEFDRTEVTITPKLQGFTFALVIPPNITINTSSFRDLVAEYQWVESVLGNSSFTAAAPLANIPELGIFYSGAIHPKLAKTEARRNCIQGTGVLTFSVSAVEISGSGSGSGSGT
ncbi:cartilage intermediate layer protein 1-like [Styela clava]